MVPNHLAPAVTQMVWYKVGSTDEVPGKTGLAHYLEHLMFRGTANLAPGEFSKIIAAQGGNDNAFTSYDYTAFHRNRCSRPAADDHADGSRPNAKSAHHARNRDAGTQRRAR